MILISVNLLDPLHDLERAEIGVMSLDRKWLKHFSERDIHSLEEPLRSLLNLIQVPTEVNIFIREKVGDSPGRHSDPSVID